MTDYRIVYDDPDNLEEPSSVVIPTDQWMGAAMAGLLPPISVYLDLNADEQKAIEEGRHQNYSHDPDKFNLQYTAPRIGPLTEEQALEYLVMKDVPKRVWGKKHNRPMFRIVHKEEIPTDRTFRDAWEMAV